MKRFLRYIFNLINKDKWLDAVNIELQNMKKKKKKT